MASQPRDNKLLDALERLAVKPFHGRVWRVVKEDRDPCRYSAAGNRWDNGEFEVLYTSLTREGAIAEIYFHLRRGQPVFPSKLRYSLYELDVNINGVFDLSDKGTLKELGLDLSQYGQLSYIDRHSEYPSCQQVGEAAHFLGSDEDGEASGILVPNARYSCANLVVFGDYVCPHQIEVVECHGLIDWKRDAT